MTLPFGVTCRVVADRARVIVEESASNEQTIHLIGICGTAMATLAAMLKRKGFDVRGSDQDVYPPMSDFLPPRDSGTRGIAPTHHARSRSRRRRQRDLARQSRARGSARSQDPVLLAARSDPRALSLGRAVDRRRRHARQDDHDVADGWLLTHGGVDPSVLVGGIAGTSASRVELSHRRGRDFVIEGTSTTARSSTRPRSS
jgi:UDP-N-acetylmuramate: L-alanyl-gamma-D-glutamyl-meso-diaminopimelate ligase